MRRFFHQRVARARASPFRNASCSSPSSAASACSSGCVAPPSHPRTALLGRRGEAHDRAAAVGGILAPRDQPVLLELARERRGGGQRQAELAGELADRPLALAADVGEERHVPAPERRALDEAEQLRRRPPPRPEAAHHPAQEPAELRHLLALVIIR